MDISCKGACPSPHPDNKTQMSKPPSRGALQLPAQGLNPLPAQGPVRAANSVKLEVITMNVNSWRAFRDKWASEGLPDELTSAHVVFIQEHRLESAQECDDATEWCGARGFHAVFQRACTSETGRPSCGVAILVAQRDDFGVTAPALQLDPEESARIMALKLSTPAMDETLLINAYFEDSRGLSAFNRQLLAKMAIWQQEFAMPIIGGGDFNIPADILAREVEYWRRSRLQLVAPSSPSYTTSKAATTIDYFVVSSVLIDQVISREVLRHFPLAPHSPVKIILEYGEEVYVPVLEVPRKLPLVPPFGPAQLPPDWAPLQARLSEAHTYYDQWPLGRPPSQGEKAQVLDQCYGTFADVFEETLCVLLDVPRQRRSQRGAPARIKRVQARRRGKAHFQAWNTFIRPLHWLKKWVQSALRYVQGCDTELQSAIGLKDDLLDAYSEFRTVPVLIQLFARAQELTEALILDEHAGFDVPSLNVEAFSDLLQAVDEVLTGELRLQSSGHQKAWSEWVKNPVHAKTNGWAHRWTATRQPWRPLVASPGQTGQPIQILEDERRRLAAIWGCQELPAPWFEAPPEAWKELPPPPQRRPSPRPPSPSPRPRPPRGTGSTRGTTAS